MPFRPVLFAALAASLSLTACDDQASSYADGDGDPLIMVEDTDTAMNAAKAEAQSTLPEWLDVLADPPEGTGDIAFKFPLGGTEHIWVGNVQQDGDDLLGNLVNAPHAEGYALGDPVRVPMGEVSDWTYRDANGVVQGHRTTRVLFDQMPPETAAAIKQDFGWE